MSESAVETVIEPRIADLGEFSVRRVIPHVKKRTVGPFVFFDHMGPVVFGPGQGVNVRPHPHIGLATVTYLFDGAILHRDSLGTEQSIEPGAVNWMVAGRGIVHSERTSEEDLSRNVAMEGIQAWIGLPADDEEADPSFDHHAADTLPTFERAGVSYRLICGTAFGQQAPVRVFSPIFYLSVEAPAGAPVDVPDDHPERAAYIVDGEVEIGGTSYDTGKMAIFEPGSDPAMIATTRTRLMLLGGAPLDGERTIWWNFVASDRDRIDAAKSRWKSGGFDIVPGDEDEFIPLPDK